MPDLKSVTIVLHFFRKKSQFSAILAFAFQIYESLETCFIFADKKDAKEIQSSNGHELARNLSLSTIHEERTSQLYDTPQTDHSVTLDDRGEVSFSFDGKEVSVSLYETPDLTEEEALQIVEMYADQLSEHVTGKIFI